MTADGIDILEEPIVLSSGLGSEYSICVCTSDGLSFSNPLISILMYLLQHGTE